MPRFLEDFAVGQVFDSEALPLEAEQIARFDEEFHVPSDRPGSQAADGWHIAALTMRLLVLSELSPAGGMVGLGMDELAWPSPAHAGDELRARAEVLDVRQSDSRPEYGLVKMRVTTSTASGEAVQIMTANLLVPKGRPKSE